MSAKRTVEGQPVFPDLAQFRRSLFFLAGLRLAPYLGVMSEPDELRWKATYPALAEASRRRGDLTPDIRAELAPDLSDDDFEAGAQGVSRYLQHLASSDRDLIYEEYFLVLSLAAQACVIHALAPKAIEAKRGEIEAALRYLISPFRKWLGGDLQRAHAPFLNRWPFPELIRRQAANDTPGSTS